MHICIGIPSLSLSYEGGEICLPVCWESGERKRNLKDGTLYNRFLVLLLALTNENVDANASTHTLSYPNKSSKREKCYGETLLASIIIILNQQTTMHWRAGKNEIEKNVKIDDENSCRLTCLFTKNAYGQGVFFFPSLLLPAHTYMQAK